MYCISNGWGIPKDESIIVILPRPAADAKCEYFLVIFNYLLSRLISLKKKSWKLIKAHPRADLFSLLMLQDLMSFLLGLLLKTYCTKFST